MMRRTQAGFAAIALFFLSTGVALAQPAAPTVDTSGNLVTLNFPGADVHEVAKAILGDILGYNYAVDPSVHATVTVVTAQPVPKSEVLGLFDSSLRAIGLTLTLQGNLYTILPLEDARKLGQLVNRGDVGFGTEKIELHYISAAELKKLIQPIVPDKSITQVDTSRNLLLITGTSEQRKLIRGLVEQFDIDGMRGMAMALITPQRTDSRTLAVELDQLLNAPGAPTSGLVHVVSIDRLNAILAVSRQPAYLQQVRRWVQRLDAQGQESERRLFVYRVQNGRAADLAAALINAFGGTAKAGSPIAQAAGATSSTSTAQPVAPIGTAADNSTTTGLASDLAAMGGGGQPGAPVAAQTLLLGNSLSPVTISSDENNNAIIVYATPSQYNIVVDALHQLDAPPMQVMIEAAIAEVTLNDALRFGVQWDFHDGQGQIALTNSKTISVHPALPGFAYLISNGSTISATLDALSKVTDVNVVSAPKLLVLNNHTAALQVGDQVPIATQSAVGVTTADAPIVNSIQYQATGVILHVTPRVNDSGLVLLDISQQVSDVATTQSSQIDSPTIQNREVTTSVAVQDGQTVALGGLIRDSYTRSNGGVPYLSSIPVLGNLFGTTNNEHDRTELIILLTPRVVRNINDAQSITDELHRKMQSLTSVLSRGGDPR